MSEQPRLEIVPLTQREARAWIEEHHRHHPAPRGDVFRLGVADESGRIRGVAMIGRPVARGYQDGSTLEVNRVATDGCPNACSALYGAAWRAARALGWRRLVTYTLASESGSSLRGAGWRIVGERAARSWEADNDPESRPRVDTNEVTDQTKLCWEAA